MKYKDENGNWIDIHVKAIDSLPIGTILDYDGTEVPDGYEKVEEFNLIPNGPPVKTNEKRDGKWVYAKQFSFNDTISPNTTLKKTFGIKNFDKIWLDLSECYMTSTTGIVYPMDMIGYNGAFNSQMFCCLDNTDINIYSNDSWGNNWTKVITIKYTETTD